MADLRISIAATGFFCLLSLAYAARWALIGRVHHKRTDADGGSAFLYKPIMEMVYWILDPLVSFIAALHITPNQVTLASLVPAAGAGVALGFGWFGLAGVLAILAAFGDILDGLLARKTGQSSDAGEVVDAAVDRYGELFFFGGLVYYYRGHDQVLFIVLAALAGSFMISYATAKAEAMQVEAPRGAMRRGERAAYLLTGSSLTPICSTLFANSPSLALRELPIILALTVVAVVANISVVQRLSAVAAALRAREKAAAQAAFDLQDGIVTKPDVPVGTV